jgi:hypothetical protein
MYIENDGALFRSRGFMTECPEEVYFPGQGWTKYTGAVPKPQGWGEEISTEDAEAMIKRIDSSHAARTPAGRE